MSEGDTFRAQATLVYRVVCVLLAVGPVVVGALSWRFGGWRGLVIGGGLAAMLAAVVWFAATLFWALSQDGA